MKISALTESSAAYMCLCSAQSTPTHRSFAAKLFTAKESSRSAIVYCY